MVGTDVAEAVQRSLQLDQWPKHVKIRYPGARAPRIHWVVRGTGIPKDRDEVNRREVSECDGWVCDLDMMGVPSKLSVRFHGWCARLRELPGVLTSAHNLGSDPVLVSIGLLHLACCAVSNYVLPSLFISLDIKSLKLEGKLRAQKHRSRQFVKTELSKEIYVAQLAFSRLKILR